MPKSSSLSLRTLFWGFTTPDLVVAVKSVRSQCSHSLWVGKDASCDYKIIDFYEYALERLPRLEPTCVDNVVLSADEKNSVYCVLQRELMGWQHGHVDFQQLLQFFVRWYAQLLLKNHIERIWFAYIPHLGSELILYYVARALNIRTRMFYQSLFANRTFLIDKIEDFGRISAHQGSYPDFQQDFNFGIPEQDWFYMRSLPKQISSAAWLRQIGWKRLKSYLRGKVPHLGVMALAHAYAERQQWLEQQQEIRWHQIEDFAGKDFVYFPLHMQPELTTDPLGGGYGDQARAIEHLRRILPEDVAIVLKENPKQTFEWRDPAFFTRIFRLKNVYFVDAKVNTYVLLKQAVAVGSITGTVGWEGVLAGKPVLVVGSAWYRDLGGVFEVSQGCDWQQVRAFRPDFVQLRAQLAKLASHLPEAITDMHYIAIYPDYDPQKNQQALIEILSND